MNHSAHGETKFLRKTIDIHPDLVETIEVIAKKSNRSFSYTCYTLLQQAVKEKLRKKSHSALENSR